VTYWIAIQAYMNEFSGLWFWKTTDEIAGFQADWQNDDTGGDCYNFENDRYLGECIGAGLSDYVFDINPRPTAGAERHARAS
jgi:hypothetical protein